MTQQEQPPRHAFWTSIPGLLSGAAAVLTALTGLFLALRPTTDTAGVREAGVASGWEETTPRTPERTPEVWERVALDRFSSPVSDWYTGTSSNAFAEMDLAIEGGAYRWTTRFLTDRTTYWYAPYPTALDLKVAVDVAFSVSGPAGANVGLIFGHARGRYYVLRISSNAQYVLQHSDGNEYTNILGWNAAALVPGERNSVELTVVDGLVRIYINDAFKGEYRIESFSGGKVGLMVSGSEGALVEAEFDNFELLKRASP